MNIIGRRRLWYWISSLMLVPGLVALAVFGLRLGIDFTGGSVLEVTGPITKEELNQLAEQKQFENITITSTETGQVVRYRVKEGEEGSQKQQEFTGELEGLGVTISRFDQVGPSVSRDIAQNALISVGLVSIAIILYIAYSFRKVPQPVSSWSFGVMAVLALLHDGLLVLGIFSILGKWLSVEIDAYFVTAILTVLGFSVHDTIVVFDRIRENLVKAPGKISLVVNNSINEVFVRSMNTSIVVVLVLLALFLFGGSSTRYFVLALLVGIISGAYSSIFIASPLLVSWQEYKERRTDSFITRIKTKLKRFVPKFKKVKSKKR